MAGYIFETVLLPEFVTKMSAPSKAIPKGKDPTGKVQRLVPPLACSLVMWSLLPFVTQMLAPSKTIPAGPSLAEKVTNAVERFALRDKISVGQRKLSFSHRARLPDLCD